MEKEWDCQRNHTKACATGSLRRDARSPGLIVRIGCSAGPPLKARLQLWRHAPLSPAQGRKALGRSLLLRPAALTATNVCVCACERCLPFHVVADIEGRPIFMSHHDPAESFPLSWLRKNFDADRSLKECFCGESRHRHGWPHCGVSDSSAYDLKS